MGITLIQNITDQNFLEVVVQSPLPTLVDFWAPWCKPCLALSPYIDEIAKEFEGKLQVGKMDVQEHTEIPTQYGVSALPVLILYQGDQVLARLAGVPSKTQIYKFVQTTLDKIK